MKRIIKLSDAIAFIFTFTVGLAISASYSDTFNFDDVFMVMFFMLVGFISIFLLHGEKVKGVNDGFCNWITWFAICT